MKQLKKEHWLYSGLALLALTVLFFIFSNPQKKSRTYLDDQEFKKGPCPGPVEMIEVDQKQMSYLPNWYACHEVKKDELVLLRFSGTLPPVVKRVRAIPGDYFKLIQNKDFDVWQIQINGRFLMDTEKEAHYFGGKNPPLLSLYEKSKAGKLESNHYLVFSEKSPGDFDSGTLGVVNSDDFLGKVEEIK